MGKIVIVNGSPRAPKSNSKQYAAIFKEFYQAGASEADAIREYAVIQDEYAAIAQAVKDCSDLLFVYPLYADGIPVVLLDFLKYLEKHVPANKPQVSAIVNCGFFEPEQTKVSLSMLRLFCRQAGLPFSSCLSIGSGEAFLTTPLAFMVKRKIKQLAKALQKGRKREMQVTLPLPKKSFVKASTGFWLTYAEKFGVTKEQMDSMKIEGE